MSPTFSADGALVALKTVVLLFATLSFVKPESLFISLISISPIDILAAATKPVVILPPSIVVVPLDPKSPDTNDTVVLVPSLIVLVPVKVTRPVKFCP